MTAPPDQCFRIISPASRCPFDLVKADRWPDAVTAYAGKNCQALTGDLAALAQARQGFPDADEHVILPEIALKIPAGPVVRQGDEDWFSVVRWTLYALIAAEELGITVRQCGCRQNRWQP